MHLILSCSHLIDIGFRKKHISLCLESMANGQFAHDFNYITNHCLDKLKLCYFPLFELIKNRRMVGELKPWCLGIVYLKQLDRNCEVHLQYLYKMWTEEKNMKSEWGRDGGREGMNEHSTVLHSIPDLS